MPEPSIAPPSSPTSQRLSRTPLTRISQITCLSSTLGLFLGISHGATTTSLRFRAENSHRLPTSERGWYLYHKTKNYAVMTASLAEGARMAARLGLWTGVFVGLEEIVDRGRLARRGEWEGRGRRDVGSTVTAGLATGGLFSAWHRLPFITAARMAKVGFLGGLGYGVAQDVVTLMEGERLAYVDWVLRVTGFGGWGVGGGEAQGVA